MSLPNELTQRTRAFAIDVVRFRRALPKTFESFRFGGQLIDAASSTAANYRAAKRARSTREFIARLGVAEEEADESGFWLDLLVAIGDAKKEDAAPLVAEAEALTKIFVRSQQTARENMRTRNAERGIRE